MSTDLTLALNPRQQKSDRQSRAISKSLNPRNTFTFNTQSWLGFAPGLPEHIFGARAWVEGSVGLRPRSAEPQATGGTSLTVDIGFKEVEVGEGAIDSAGSGDPVCRLQSLLRTNTSGVISGEYVLTLLAVTGGDATATAGGNAGSGEMWRVQADGTWVQVVYIANVGYTDARELSAAIDGQSFSQSMGSSAAFPAGSSEHDPSVNTGSGADTSLGLPVMIYANNLNPVYVFPATGESGQPSIHRYTELHAGALEPFYARTCFAWEGRMFYGSTSEAGTRHPLRIRWSALYDASPDTALAGSGFIDIRELNGHLLRFENLDPYLVVYFSDGIVFLERTGFSAAPIRYRVVTDHRGLLGGHALAHVSPREHFGIFTDGFFMLNSSGEFRELGVIEEGGGYFRKWHDYFFTTADLSVAHRIQCHYDQSTRTVRMTIPLPVKTGTTSTNTVWTYDIERDWMIIESWTEQDAETTCFTDHNATIRAALDWDSSSAPLTWKDMTAAGGVTWESGAALFGRSNLYHATATGFVYLHDPTITTFNNVEQTWALVTARQPAPDVRTHTCWEGFDVETVDEGNANSISLQLHVQDMAGNEVSDTASVEMSNSGSATGFLKLLKFFSRLSGAYARFSLGGTGPVAIRQIIADIRMSESRLRE